DLSARFHGISNQWLPRFNSTCCGLICLDRYLATYNRLKCNRGVVQRTLAAIRFGSSAPFPYAYDTARYGSRDGLGRLLGRLASSKAQCRRSDMETEHATTRPEARQVIPHSAFPIPHWNGFSAEENLLVICHCSASTLQRHRV